MSEANKYGQGDNHTMEARIIRNPAFEGLEPKPDAEALKEVQPPTHTIHGHQCIYCRQHWADCAAYPICHSSAQPKSDAAGEAKKAIRDNLNAIYNATIEHDSGIATLAERCLNALPALSAPRNSALEEIGGFDKYWPVYGLRQADLNEDHSLEYIRSIANRFYKVGFHDSASDLRKSHRKLEDAAKEMAEREQKEAFVRGAKWWEFEKTGATMWQSDQNKAWEVAESRLRANPSEGGDGYDL